MIPYVGVQNIEGKPYVVVDTGIGSQHRYPLNFDGCRQAGRALFTLGAEEWQCSSSVDFPQETLPGFRGDVRALMSEGYQQEMEKATFPRKSAIAKILAHCSKSEFLNTLTPEEREAFNKIKSEYKG